MTMTKPMSKPCLQSPRRLSRLLAIITILILMLCMGIFTTTALASVKSEIPPPLPEESAAETLIVNAAWLDGDTIRIDVTDPQTGSRSTIAVPVNEHLLDGENVEFIIIQAVDQYGIQSGEIKIRNPLFNPSLPKSDTESEIDVEVASGNEEDSEDAGNGESDFENNQLRPFTPDGTATVVDNVADRDREFFTIFSEDGNEFFLVIDRHRDNENVYFLNAVTEEDLMALARRVGREITTNESAIPIPPHVPEPEVEPEEKPEPEPEPARPSALGRIGNNMLIFVGIIGVVGGAAYYLKVVRPKKEGFSEGYDYEPDDYGFEGDEGGGNSDDEDAVTTESEDGDDD